VVDNPQKPLTNPPDAAGAEIKVGRFRHVADLQMITIGDHIDGNPHAVRHGKLRARLIDRIDEPAAELSGIFESKRGDPGLRAGLVERVDGLDMDERPSVENTIWDTALPAGNRKARSSRSTLIT
jgi:hypothetical protein